MNRTVRHPLSVPRYRKISPKLSDATACDLPGSHTSHTRARTALLRLYTWTRTRTWTRIRRILVARILTSAQ
jgi:hypothetical protein